MARCYRAPKLCGSTQRQSKAVLLWNEPSSFQYRLWHHFIENWYDALSQIQKAQARVRYKLCDHESRWILLIPRVQVLQSSLWCQHSSNHERCQRQANYREQFLHRKSSHHVPCLDKDSVSNQRALKSNHIHLESQNQSQYWHSNHTCFLLVLFMPNFASKFLRQTYSNRS